MIEEIYEQPTALAITLESAFNEARRIVQRLDARGLGMVYFIGSGTSYHACLCANFALSTLTRMFATSLPASEFSSWIRHTERPDILLVAISQSGESSDVMGAVNAAIDSGIRVVAVTNVPQSTLARSTDLRLVSKAGEERAVTATKSFTATLAAAYAFVLELAKTYAVGPTVIEPLAANLREARRHVEETIRLCDDKARKLAVEFKQKEFFFILGSGSNYPVALEGALKLKETCNLYAEGFATREFLHGPMQLVDDRTPVFILQSHGEAEQAHRLAESFMRFGAPTVAVGPREMDISQESRTTFEIAQGVADVLSPLVYVVPLQLFAYYSSVVRGLNPDRPKKLRKVVK